MWKCPRCGEGVDDQFEVCWNCQRQKDDLSPPSGNAAGTVTGSEDPFQEPEREDEIEADGPPIRKLDFTRTRAKT